jgi:inorganic pyrophosphatase
MILDRVSPGADVPNDINVIIEIPSHSDPVKYDCNYGYIPHTLSDDGDAADVLVVTPTPLISGAVIRCRPVGMLQMTDESGVDAKILAVPVDKLAVQYRGVEKLADMAPLLLEQIAHFFEHYKDLENNKWVKIDGWVDIDEAKAEIMESIKRYNDAPEKPAF